jgi:hypothetical protein
MSLAANQFRQIGENFFAMGINRAQFDALSLERRNSACGEDFQAEVQRQGTRMKQVQRPKINRASSEVGTAGRKGCDGRLDGRTGLSGHAKVVSRATGNQKNQPLDDLPGFTPESSLSLSTSVTVTCTSST